MTASRSADDRSDTTDAEAGTTVEDGTTVDGGTNASGDGSDATGDDSLRLGDPGDVLLSVRDLTKRFGGVTAVDGASFDVEAGTMTGLIGPNGAGKSTTFNLITGVHDADGGRIVFDGHDISGARPNVVARRGLVRTFQIARELEEMTVLENVMLAPPNQRGETLWRTVLPGARRQVREQERELREEAWEMLDFFELDHLAEEEAGNLSGGQRKLLEMARVLMTDPEMVLLDEPFAGVNPVLEEKLLDRLYTLREEGYTFLLVEHDMDLVMAHCDPVIVMHQGEVLAEGPPETIRDDERVIEAYLGGELE